MPEKTAIVRRPYVPLAVRAYQEQVQRSKTRLRKAVVHLQERARELTPGSRIGARPGRWLLGAFAVGLALGWVTAPRRR